MADMPTLRASALLHCYLGNPTGRSAFYNSYVQELVTNFVQGNIGTVGFRRLGTRDFHRPSVGLWGLRRTPNFRRFQKIQNVVPPLPRPRRGLGDGAATFSIGLRTGRDFLSMSHRSGQNGSNARPSDDFNDGI